MMLSDITRLETLTRWAHANDITVNVDMWFSKDGPKVILKFEFPKRINAEYNHMLDLKLMVDTGAADSVMTTECRVIATKLDKILREGGLF